MYTKKWKREEGRDINKKNVKENNFDKQIRSPKLETNTKMK